MFIITTFILVIALRAVCLSVTHHRKIPTLVEVIAVIEFRAIYIFWNYKEVITDSNVLSFLRINNGSQSCEDCKGSDASQILRWSQVTTTIMESAPCIIWMYFELINPNSLDNKGSWGIFKEFYCSVTMIRELGLMRGHGRGLQCEEQSETSLLYPYL